MSELKVTTLSNQSGVTVPVDTVISGTAKAWVNFNGTGTVAIRRAFNVSTVTDNGTGDYTVNFTTAMVDANYAYVFGTSVNRMLQSQSTSGVVLTTSIRVLTYDTGFSAGDTADVCVSIFS
tara:strand:+ start:1071 stop:1433 length:363 start_codon:yes stop_codon:yes gene_type:complete